MFKAEEFTPSDKLSKVLGVGTHYARIVDISYDTLPFTGRDGGALTKLQFTLEGPAIEDPNFVGASYDKNNPSLGNFAGQVAWVSHSRYFFKNGVIVSKDKDGNVTKELPITKEEEAFKWLRNMCVQMGVWDQMIKDDVACDTIEDFVSEAAKYLLNPDLWGFFTIGGKEKDAGEYGIQYNMYFPERQGKMYPYVAAETEDLEKTVGVANFFVFDPMKHIQKLDVDASTSSEPVKGFTSTGGLL